MIHTATQLKAKVRNLSWETVVESTTKLIADSMIPAMAEQIESVSG